MRKLRPTWNSHFNPVSQKAEAHFMNLPVGVNVENVAITISRRRAWKFYPGDSVGSESRAIGVSYPTLSGNLEHVNYASIRQAVLAERAVWNSFQMFLFLELLFPIYEAFFTDLLGSWRTAGKRTGSWS